MSTEQCMQQSFCWETLSKLLFTIKKSLREVTLEFHYPPD